MARAASPGSCCEAVPGIDTWAICRAAAGWETAIRVSSLRLNCSSSEAAALDLLAACLAVLMLTCKAPGNGACVKDLLEFAKLMQDQ